MATPVKVEPIKAEKDLKKLEAEQAKEDADLLDSLDKEAKEFDKVHQPTRYPQ